MSDRVSPDDPELRQKMARASFDRSAQFSVDRMLDETIAVYHAVLRHRRARRATI